MCFSTSPSAVVEEDAVGRSPITQRLLKIAITDTCPKDEMNC
jgi:hypothetical protein